MTILVFNCGSSSLTYKVYDSGEVTGDRVLVSGKAHRVGVRGSAPSFIEHHPGGSTVRNEIPIANHRDAASLVFAFLDERKIPVDAIGHRFVHGGSSFTGAAFVTKETLRKLRSCLPLAPIHNPMALSVIITSRKARPDARQYVTFDSAFHATIPPHAYTYAVKSKIAAKLGFWKYGFHGLSYSYVLSETARLLDRPAAKTNMVACHLGTGGSSVCAIQDGSSLDTSMGFSPLPGLMMSTRSGDVDPMLTLFLLAFYGYRPDKALDLLNKSSGLLGVSGFSSDIRDIIGRVPEKAGAAERADLAFRMYIHRLKKYIGSYLLVLGRIDALVFTDDIGVRNPAVREAVCRGLGWGGIVLDLQANDCAPIDAVGRLDDRKSRVAILSIPTDEEIVICREGRKLMEEA